MLEERRDKWANYVNTFSLNDFSAHEDFYIHYLSFKADLKFPGWPPLPCPHAATRTFLKEHMLTAN